MEGKTGEPTVIPVDLNSMARGGMVKASMRRVTGPVEVGDVVIVRDHGESLDFRAVVREVEDNRIYLELDWQATQS